MTLLFSDLDEFRASAVGDLGTSDWTTLTQSYIDHFADLTNDHQWIHVDQEAAARGPFASTIAHGYLTLALVPPMVASIFTVGNVTLGLNYGAERVRFPTPVRAGSRIRATARLHSFRDLEIGTQARIGVVVELEGSDKPACVVDMLLVYVR